MQQLHHWSYICQLQLRPGCLPGRPAPLPPRQPGRQPGWCELIGEGREERKVEAGEGNTGH